jgi:hypothetical protein
MKWFFWLLDWISGRRAREAAQLRAIEALHNRATAEEEARRSDDPLSTLRRRFPRDFGLLAVLGLLAGCAGSPATTITDTACLWVRPVLIAPGDVLTRPTAIDLLAHNLAWERNCKAKSP